MACCKCVDFGKCNCESQNKVPIEQHRFLVDQRSERKLRNKSIYLASAQNRRKSSRHVTHPSEIDESNENVAVEMDQPSTSNPSTSVTRNGPYEVKSLLEDLGEPLTSDYQPSTNLTTRWSVIGRTALALNAYNTTEIIEVAKAADRWGISNRAAGAIATATLIDFGIISATDRKFIIDRNKVSRARDKVGTKQLRNLSFDNIQALYFDGRKDWTRVLHGNAMKLEREEHISFVEEPHSFFIGHKTTESSTAEGHADAVKTILFDKKIPPEAINAIGCDGTSVNTGEFGGCIRILEEQWNRPLQWIICMLHMVELPLRALITQIDGTTVGPRAFSGPIGRKLTDCNLKSPVDFTPINFDYNTDSNDVDREYLTNTDQKYLLDICNAISEGRVSESLARREPGAMCHSRWLTTANRILRLYVTQSAPSANLRILTSFIMKVYVPMVFEIKKKSSVVNGSLHIARMIQLSQFLPNQYLNIVKVSISRNAFMAHPENFVLALLNDDDTDVRREAWLRILSARNTNSNGTGVRFFKVPKLNFECTSYKDLITFHSANPPLLRDLRLNEEIIDFMASKPILDHDIGFDLMKIPLHTQAVERSVKVVTEASRHVCGEDKRDKWIVNTLHSRNVMPTFNSKKEFSFSESLAHNLKI